MEKRSRSVWSRFKVGALVVVFTAVCALMLCGCAGGTTEANDPQTLNRQYMANVNQIMEEIDAQTTELSEVIKEGEVVSLATQLATIDESIDKLKALSVPDDMKDIQADYVKGAEDLQGALRAYVELYENVKAPENGTFDYATYGDRLNDIRTQYESGIEALKSADQKASDA